METQRVFLKGKFEKHIMCFSDFSFRNTFCVSVGKTLWKSQNVSLNGFFQGKHHPAPAVDDDQVCYCMEIASHCSKAHNLR